VLRESSLEHRKSVREPAVLTVEIGQLQRQVGTWLGFPALLEVFEL
jgi:hypothetical protein